MKIELVPKKLIYEFIDTRLQGDVGRLVSFPLAQLSKDKKFGCPGRSFDYDDTNLMRAIYCLAFADAWPGLNMASLADWSYRGETLNTYNTMFGKPDATSLHPGIDRYAPTKEFEDKVEEFYIAFGTIGNMAVLPNKVNAKRTTINCYRGCHRDWRDFTDRFLCALYNIFTEQGEIDEGLKDLIDINRNSFEAYLIPGGFAELSRKLMLEDYLDAENQPVLNSKGYYYWRKNNDRDDYLAEAGRYIDFSTQVIRNRGKRMVDALKLIL